MQAYAILFVIFLFFVFLPKICICQKNMLSLYSFSGVRDVLRHSLGRNLGLTYPPTPYIYYVYIP